MQEADPIGAISFESSRRRIARPSPPAAAALLAAAATSCSAPQSAIANLDELYAARDGARGSYAADVTDRSLLGATKLDWSAIFGGEESPAAREELEDPIAFAMENLAEVEEASAEGDLDEFETGQAVAVVTEIATIDPARILRARAFETAAHLARGIGAGGFRFATAPIDEAELGAQIDALIEWAAADGEDGGIVASRSGDLAAGARALAACKPSDLALSQKLLRLASKCGRLASVSRPTDEAGGGLPEELSRACTHLALHTAFLSARPDPEHGRGIADPAPDVGRAAGRLLVGIDAAAATVELGLVYLQVADPLVRTAWLRALGEARLTGSEVHPSLRAPLARELEAEDAAVAWWARRTLAAMVGLGDAAASIDEVKARWLALGEWEGPAREG